LGRLLNRVDDFFRRRLWQDEGHPPAVLFAYQCLRILILAGRGLIKDQSLVRSSALAYATILGFIPLFALLFAILQALGMPRLLATYFLENLAPGSEPHTDALKSYEGFNEYTHKVVDHVEEYVNGNVHTNRLENFWSLLKRAIKGTYVSVEPFHLFRNLDEQSFRYNGCHNTDAERFAKILCSIRGKRLTYNTLTSQEVG